MKKLLTTLVFSVLLVATMFAADGIITNMKIDNTIVKTSNKGQTFLCSAEINSATDVYSKQFTFAGFQDMDSLFYGYYATQADDSCSFTIELLGTWFENAANSSYIVLDTLVDAATGTTATYSSTKAMSKAPYNKLRFSVPVDSLLGDETQKVYISGYSH